MSKRQRDRRTKRRQEWNKAHKGDTLARVEAELQLVEAAVALSAKGFVIPTSGMVWTPDGFVPNAVP